MGSLLALDSLRSLPSPLPSSRREHNRFKRAMDIEMIAGKGRSRVRTFTNEGRGSGAEPDEDPAVAAVHLRASKGE